MQSAPGHSGEMSQNSVHAPVHRSHVDADAPGEPKPIGEAVSRGAGSIDPAARSSRRMYDGLSASSAGLELGIAVARGALFGHWLDGKLGTEPWMLLVFLVIGLVAGFRGVLRAVARAERADRADRTDRTDGTESAARRG
ncbi:MAG TPA: AtpZ/AtpI family protein [Kofleriaceae bacterium]